MKAFFLFGQLEGTSVFLSAGGEQQRPFLIHWTTENPREPGPLSPACRWEQSGAKFRPSPVAFFWGGGTPPILINHTSNKENFNTIATMSALLVRVSHSRFYSQPPTPSPPPCDSCLNLWKRIPLNCSEEAGGLVQAAGCRWLVTLCRARWTAVGPFLSLRSCFVTAVCSALSKECFWHFLIKCFHNL